MSIKEQIKTNAMEYAKSLDTKELTEKRSIICKAMEAVQETVEHIMHNINAIAAQQSRYKKIDVNEFNRIFMDLQRDFYLVKDVLEWHISNNEVLKGMLEDYEKILKTVIEHPSFNKVVTKFYKDHITFTEMQEESSEIN